MLQLTPPLGWNSWNTIGNDIDEKIVCETADAMVENGLRDCGYTYLVIDDSWSKRQRDKSHRLVPNEEKFPHGMKYLADYVHARGLKLGIYSCAGNMTCGRYPGSYEHEFLDAKTFAEWEIDYLKYDYCFKPAGDQGDLLYRRMGAALLNCGRDILFSACSWGVDNTKEWIKTTGANSWRSTVDIFDVWESIKRLAKEQRDIQAYQSIGCFNDMDMLVTGMDGKGNVGVNGCTYIQYRTHFSLWSFLGSSLMIGCDIREIDAKTLSILTNREVLAINQDPACRQPFIIGGCQTFISGGDDERFIWAKLLHNGDFAIGMFNLSDSSSNMYFCMAELGLNRSCGKKLVMTDLWTGNVYETCDYHFTATLEANDCLLLRARIVDED